MTFLTQNEIANSPTMQSRIAQCAAGEGVSAYVFTPNPATAADPDRWAYERRREWAAAPEWDDAWEYAKLTHEDDPDYDPGVDSAVITDGQILAQVQSMLQPVEGGVS